MADTPDWIQKARNKWDYYGQKRPDFAIEPKKGEESVWDYPRPPRLEKDSRKVIVMFNDITIAETTSAFRVLETASPPTFYISPKDVNFEFIKKDSGTSLCEWKGNAQYWLVQTEDERLRQVAWSYPDPFKEFSEIAGYLSFYPAKLSCFVNGERVKPQPGGFYGGWITSEIKGPVKGESRETLL